MGQPKGLSSLSRFIISNFFEGIKTTLASEFLNARLLPKAQ